MNAQAGDQIRSENGPIRVVVAGNTRMHAELLAEAVQRDPAIQVVGCVSSSKDLFHVAAKTKIDVAVISSHLDEQPDRGFEVVNDLHLGDPEMRAIMLLDSDKRQSVVSAFQAGAKGIFSRNSPLTGLCKCIRCVHEGQIWASHEELQIAFSTLTGPFPARPLEGFTVSRLTNREREVVECVADGLATHEIADRLQLSKHTVKNSLTRIFKKLGVSNRIELLFFVLARTPEGNSRASGFGVAEFREVNIPRDPTAAYAWCLVNEKNISKTKKQVSAVKKRLAESMTPEQVVNAESQAAAWPKKDAQSHHLDKLGEILRTKSKY